MALHLKKYTYSILGFLALFAFVLVPDVVFSFFNTSFELSSSISGKNIIIAMLIAFFINFSASKKTIIFIISLCFLMQATQLAYFHYFGVFYGGYDLTGLLAGEAATVAAMADGTNILLVPLAVSFALYLAALVFYLLFFSKTKKLPFLSVLFVIALLVPFLQALSSDTSQKFQPNSTHLSIKNGLYAISYFSAQKVEHLFESGENSSLETEKIE